MVQDRVVGTGEVYSWIEGFSIMVAVVIVVLASSINDYQRDQVTETVFQKQRCVDIRLVWGT